MDESTTSPFVDVLNNAARTIHAAASTEERAHAIVKAAADAIPGFDQASVSVAYRDGPPQTRAATSDFVLALDLVQYEAEEGPCYDAFTLPNVVTAPFMRDEQRWPAYTPRAISEGVTAQMALPLRDGREVRGALNMYSTTTEDIDLDAPDIAALFATQVALALGWARAEEQLNLALSTRKDIGQAIGLVMERYHISEVKAFAFLLRLSSSGNKKIRDVAHELITQSDTRYTMKDSR